MRTDYTNTGDKIHSIHKSEKIKQNIKEGDTRGRSSRLKTFGNAQTTRRERGPSTESLTGNTGQ